MKNHRVKWVLPKKNLQTEENSAEFSNNYKDVIRPHGWGKELLKKSYDKEAVAKHSQPTSLASIVKDDPNFGKVASPFVPNRPYKFSNLISALEGGLKRGKVYSFFGAEFSGTTRFITNLAKQICINPDPEEVHDLGYTPSYYFIDKERTQAEFSNDFFAEEIKKGSFDHMEDKDSYLPIDELVDSYSNLNYECWGQTHQRGWYEVHLSGKLDDNSNPSKTPIGANLDVLFYNGVQSIDLLHDLKELAIKYNCAVITTSTIKSKKPSLQSSEESEFNKLTFNNIDPNILNFCYFAATLKKKTELEVKHETLGTHRLYIIKNSFLKNEAYNGVVKFVHKGAAQRAELKSLKSIKSQKKSNHLLFDFLPDYRVEAQGFFKDILEKDPNITLLE